MLENIKEYYKGLTHQIKAVTWLEATLKVNGYGNIKILELPKESAIRLEKLLSKNTMACFVDMWRDDVEDVYNPVYFSQIDNKILPYTTCNSSSNAVLLATMKKGSIKNDDEYVTRVFSGKYGYKGERNPSIYHDLHTRVLASYGLNTIWMTDRNIKAVLMAIKSHPIVVNILHKGLIGSNLGGGHVICLVKQENGVLTVFDPYGLYNWKTGEYRVGAKGVYTVSVDLFLKRWQGGYRLIK
jgi:hypothetical protein